MSHGLKIPVLELCVLSSFVTLLLNYLIFRAGAVISVDALLANSSMRLYVLVATSACT
jgi:hypothetical protein